MPDFDFTSSEFALISLQPSKRGTRVDRVCETCGKDFKVFLSAITGTNATGRFCSRPCYTEFKKTLTGQKSHMYNKVDTQCSYCGVQIQVIPARMDAYESHYCSNDCRHKAHVGAYAGAKNPNWRGGHIKRKGNFATVKSIHFPGVKFCAFCGTTKKIHIHHIIPYRYTQDNSLTNLIPLCVSHHRVVELLTWDILESSEDTDYEYAKELLNNILRSIQFVTYQNIKKIIEARKSE